jgi:hypothetical protein
LSFVPSAGVAQVEFSGDSLNRACRDDEQAQFCRGVITTASAILLDACNQGDYPTFFWPVAADIAGVTLLDIKDEFLARMQDTEFRRSWGSARAQMAVMMATAERWPCMASTE